MQYVLVQFDQKGLAYQEALYGNVQGYKDALGVPMFAQPPIGEGCQVSQVQPAALLWFLPDPPPNPLPIVPAVVGGAAGA